MTALIPTPQPQTPLPIKRALVSVSDKTNIDVLAASFIKHHIQALSTGGTAKALREAGVEVIDVAEYTGFPEMMDGRVKTLHPRIHGGILGRKGIDDDVLAEHDIAYFDLVVVNLYPFAETIAKPDCSYEEAVENIDIGGPSMLRAAAKNHAHIAVVTDPAEYGALAEALDEEGAVEFGLRQFWAAKAFAHSANYEAHIAQYLIDVIEQRAEEEAEEDSTETGNTLVSEADAEEEIPSDFTLSVSNGEALRYGENPHQSAQFYQMSDAKSGTLGAAHLLQGKALSYNNIADADAALECVKSFSQTACVIVKHANPCGVAVAEDQLSAYQRAYEGDPTSAFGGIIAFNQALEVETAKQILANQYAEVIIAPEIDAAVLKVLSAKPNIRVMMTGQWQGFDDAKMLKAVSGGLLIQSADTIQQSPADWRVVSQRQPSEQEWSDLQFAWSVVRFTKSNAIVFVKDQRTVGIGAGQMSRVVSVKIAAMKAQEESLSTEGAVMASDAFFPFADGLEAALAHGLTAVIHPGGSMRDDEIIAAADKAGIAMVMTGTRHFRH